MHIQKREKDASVYVAITQVLSLLLSYTVIYTHVLVLVLVRTHTHTHTQATHTNVSLLATVVFVLYKALLLRSFFLLHVVYPFAHLLLHISVCF